MPAEPARTEPLPDEAESDVLLSRQAVVDARLRMYSYRVAYATPQAPGRPTPDSSTTRLSHLPSSRELLLSLGMPPVGPDRVIVRVTQEIALEPDIQEILRSLVGRGYALAVKADPAPGFDLALLELFGTVELEFAGWDAATLAALVPKIRAGRAIPVAVALEDHDQFDRARELGFEWFTGPFLASPRITPAKGIPVGQLGQLAALARLRAGPAEIEELEEVINRDLG